jgi:tetratricopeptide (TPR) repeat protein
MADRQDIEALFRKAVESHTQGRLAEALTLYGAVIREAPGLAAAHSNRAAVLITMKRFELALASAERALELEPNFADAWNNCGNALEGLGRAEDSLESYECAIQLKPDFVAAHNNRGNALRALSRQSESIESYTGAIALDPKYAEAYYNRGIALKDLKRLEEAVASYDGAICVRPEYAEAHNNKGNALQELERFEEALESYDRALALRPGHFEALNNRGVTLRYLKRTGEAIDALDRALKLAPEFADAHWNRSLCLLQLGRFEEGWRDYEWRLRRADQNVPRPPSERLWNGEDIAGKRLFVFSEQGLGDTIQFCRYAKLAEETGAKVVLAVQERLVRLLKSLSPTIEMIVPGGSPPEYDVCCPLLSLPRLFGTDANSISSHVPYLRAEQDRARKWRERIGQEGFKIGIGWQGEKEGIIDIGRSFPARMFESITKIPGTRLISLQKFAGSDQLANLPETMKVETLGDNFDAGPDGFLDSAAVMENLDLIVTSDTAIAHLAGALGRPTWVALKHVPDWRWLLDSSDTSWYPSMRLFRQKNRGDWAPVFADMEKQLRGIVSKSAARPAPLVPVSWGELVDRLTILEIKSVRISVAAARENIGRELEVVRKIAERALAGRVVALASQLKSINEELWDIETQIRAKESSGTFDDEFVALARSVYKKNDERARIKREISIALGSELLEEKSYSPK